MAKYQKYAEYQDLGIEWLGEIPSHWDVKRLGSFFEERREKVSDVDYPALSVTKNGIVPQLDTAAKTDAGDNRKLVKVNDFVINSRSDRKGSSGISPYTGSVSLISIVMEPHRIYPAYAHHLLRSYPFQEEFYRYGKGIVADLWSTNSSEMKNILLPDIPIIEQQKIASFLDHETSKIDSLIAKQEKLIELLKEKRQAVISHAVTKGLNPEVAMKDSGVEWLEQVPEHWEVSTIGYYAKVTNGTTPSKANLSYWDKEEIPWLSSGEVNQYYIVEASEYITAKALAECSLELLPIGTVVMGMIGQGKTRGLSAITEIEATINQNLAALVTYPKLNNEYLHYYLQAAYDYMREEGRGGNQAALNCEIIRKFPITIPPSEEQLQIVEKIKKLSITYKALIHKAESAIQLMQERRTALISSAVTGKVDVRNWQDPNEAKTGVSA